MKKFDFCLKKACFWSKKYHSMIKIMYRHLLRGAELCKTGGLPLENGGQTPASVKLSRNVINKTHQKIRANRRENGTNEALVNLKRSYLGF